MPRVKAAVSRDHELSVLAFLRDRMESPEGVVSSIGNVARETGLTVHQARAALRRLGKNGLVETIHRSFPNGASAENAYRPTQAGLDELAGAACTPCCNSLAEQGKYDERTV